MSTPKAPSNAIVAFLFALRGNQKVLTNAFRWDRTTLAIQMLTHGAWLTLNHRPTAYTTVLRSVFGIDATQGEVTMMAKAARSIETAAGDAFRALWDTRLTASNLCAIVPADAGFDRIAGNIKLTVNGDVASIMHVTSAGADVDGWIVETRQSGNAMQPKERFTVSKKEAAEKAWSEIKQHDGVTVTHLDGPVYPEARIEDAIKRMLSHAEAAVKLAEENAREKEREVEREKERKERVALDRAEKERLKRLQNERELERIAALKHQALLGKDAEGLTNEDFANKMRAKRAATETP